jgi:hypothetical protein
MASSYLSTQLDAWIDQLKSVIIACAGNDMTENSNPDRGYLMQINNKCIEYLTQGRFNIDFRNEIIKRKDLLQSHITILPIDQAVKEKLLLYFPPNPTESFLTKEILATFKSVKANCRNDWGATYHRANKIEHSGEYDDTELLRSILKKSIEDIIDGNFKKACSGNHSMVKSKVPNPDKTILDAADNQFYQDKRPYYNSKKQNWASENLPNDFLAFVLGCKPGIGMLVLQVGIEDSAQPKSKGARKGQTKLLVGIC